MAAVSGRFDRAVIALATWKPIRLAGELGPERLLINFACILIGIGALADKPPADSTLASWPRWLVYEWAVAMLVGGVCALWGIVGRHRVAEWVGYVCIGLAAAGFGLSSLIDVGTPALRVGLIFLAIAAAKGVRLLLAYAARASFLRAGSATHSPADEAP